MDIERYDQEGFTVIRLSNQFLQVDVVPAIGGRVIGIFDRKTGHQFLWRNDALPLSRCEPGSEYDPNFFGGIDELLPNDMPERINGINCADHGELWTMALHATLEERALMMSGTLPQCGLQYQKRMILSEDSPAITMKYRVHNPTNMQKVFLWKMHAALNIEPGDEIVCPAKTARVADPAWSRWSHTDAFPWPVIEGRRADLIPEKTDEADFLYLYDLADGYMAWHSPEKKLAFVYRFDRKVFPCAWYFASYGGFLGHYTAVLEPCTAMPMSVREAARMKQCSVLAPGQSIETDVRILAGAEALLPGRT